MEKYGDKDMVRGGRTKAFEGHWMRKRAVALEFPKEDRDKEWLNCEQYRAARQNAPSHRKSERDSRRRRLVMADPDSIALAASAENEGLEAVLVGGNAVNLYAYRRTTFDVDLLVRESDSQRWFTFFEQRGYRVFHRTPNFIRLHFAANPAKALPVDLMLSDEDTFNKILAGSSRRDVGEGIQLAIPTPLHLIAMKLHALKSHARAERGADVQDVIHLIKIAKIDIHSREFTDIFDRYATDTIRTKIRTELEQEPQ